MIVKEAMKDGLTAATISMILKVAPEIYKAIDFLIKNGEIDVNRFKKNWIRGCNRCWRRFYQGGYGSSGYIILLQIWDARRKNEKLLQALSALQLC